MNRAAFITKYKNPIVEATLHNDLFPSVVMAQAALESGWGKSIIGNNLFGIKANGETSPFWKGNRFISSTKEFFNGNYENQNSEFRSYASTSSSILDHSYFLYKNKRYTSNGVFSATSPENQAKALQKAGYATDPSYSSKLIDIINQNNLKTLDQTKSKMKNIEMYVTILVVAAAALLVYKYYTLKKAF
jgi:flagellum-specific peptidoglycan hydrolase FlgJ